MSRTALSRWNAKGILGQSSLWAVYVKNWVPHKARTKDLIPIELLLPAIHAECLRANLGPFGQKVKCFDYEVSDKLSHREYEGRIVGYTNTYQTYWVLDPTGKNRLAENLHSIHSGTEGESSEELLSYSNISEEEFLLNNSMSKQEAIP